MFQRPQSALALRAHTLLLVFEKSTRAYLFQITRENHVITYTNMIPRLHESGHF